MSDFKDLQVWQRSRRLVKAIYVSTAKFPADERGGMTSQIRRAIVSIAANIAEGNGRHTLTDQARCYRIANASSREAEALLILANDLEWISEPNAQPLFVELDGIQRMLTAMNRYCRGQPRTQNPKPSARNPEP